MLHWFGTLAPAVAAFQCNSISTISDISKACLLQQSRMQQFRDYPIINSRKLPSPLAISSNPRTIFQDWYFSKRCLKNPNRSKCYLFIKLHWLICLCPPRICSLSSDCGAFGVLVFSGSRFGWNCLCLDEGVLLESHPWIDKNVQWSTEKKTISPSFHVHVQYLGMLLSLSSLHIVSLTILPSVPDVCIYGSRMTAMQTPKIPRQLYCFATWRHTPVVQGHPGFHVISTACSIL